MAKTIEQTATDKNKIFAYVPAIFRSLYLVGRADLCEKGYTPLMTHGTFESYDEASKKADELNKELGLSIDTAAKIIGTTMTFENRFEKIVKKLAEFIPNRPSGDINEDDLIEWLEEEGADQIREALE